VVVWVAGAAGVVVVVLVVVGVEQPVSDARAAAARQERMIFFIRGFRFGLLLNNPSLRLHRSKAMGCNPTLRRAKATRRRELLANFWNTWHCPHSEFAERGCARRVSRRKVQIAAAGLRPSRAPFNQDTARHFPISRKAFMILKNVCLMSGNLFPISGSVLGMPENHFLISGNVSGMSGNVFLCSETLPAYQAAAYLYQERLPVCQETISLYRETSPAYQEMISLYQETPSWYREMG
jgi:hypothetical protein